MDDETPKVKRGPVYIAIDLETTGLDAFENGICEIGLAFFNLDGHLGGLSADVYVHADCAIDDKALNVNKFTRERIRAAKPLDEILMQFEADIQERFDQQPYFDGRFIAVFHNAPFDVGFLRASGAIKDGSFFDGLLRRVLDTVSLGYLCGFGEYEALSPLSTLAKREFADDEFNLLTKGLKPHQAYRDALVTAALARQYLTKYRHTHE